MSVARMNAAPRLTAVGLAKTFKGHAAIQDISFAVREGEFVAVLGPSGAGKTTLFRCLTGLLPPDKGEVRVGDDDIATLHGRARRRIAVVFQQFNLVSRLSALDNVLAGRLGHVPVWRGVLRRFGPATTGCWRWNASTGSGCCARRCSAPIRCRAASSRGWRSRAPWRSGRA